MQHIAAGTAEQWDVKVCSRLQVWWVAAGSETEGCGPTTVTIDYLTEGNNTGLFLFRSFLTKPLTKSVSENMQDLTVY